MLLDFGLSKELPEGFGLGLFELMFSMMTMNESAMMRAFKELGFRTKTGDPETYLLIARRMIERRVARQRSRRVHRGDDRRAVRVDPRGPDREGAGDFVLVARVFALLSGIAHTLGGRAATLDSLGGAR